MMAIYIRLQLGETPIFQEMKAKGAMVKNPWKEAFLSSNIKDILVAIVVFIGQGVVWYSGQFFITSAAFLSTGSIGYPLIYPIVVPAVCFLICLFIMPGTRHISIWDPEGSRPLARSAVASGRGRFRPRPACPPLLVLRSRPCPGKSPERAPVIPREEPWHDCGC